MNEDALPKTPIIPPGLVPGPLDPEQALGPLEDPLHEAARRKPRKLAHLKRLQNKSRFRRAKYGLLPHEF